MPKDSNQNLTKLTILGLLQKNNMSGYDILCHVTKYFGHITRLSASSVYYLLEKMNKDNLIKQINKKNDLKKGHSKKIFSLTKKGKDIFEFLLEETVEMKFYDPFQLALIFFDYMKKDKIKNFIQKRLDMYEQLEKKIEENKNNISNIHKNTDIDKNNKNKFFNYAMERGKNLIENDKKFLKSILKDITN